MIEAKINYAKSGEVHIAYRVFGNGPRDIVLIPGTLSHVELTWERPSNQHLLKRLTAFARVIVFENAGRGSPIESPSRRWKNGSVTCGR
jgi:hypothetical protein